MKKVEMNGAGIVVNPEEIRRNLALLDENLLRLVELIDAETIKARVDKVLKIKQEHADLVSGKGVTI